MSRCPLPSSGSPRGGFPTFRGTMRQSESLPPFPLRFLSFARRYHPALHLRLFIRRPRWRSWTWPGEFLSGSPLTVAMCDGGCRGSQVPGEPLSTCPVLRPRRTVAPGHCSATDVAFRFHDYVGSAVINYISRLNSRAHWLAVYASQGELLRSHARLASGRRPALPGRAHPSRLQW
jgi:hypothetical protein